MGQRLLKARQRRERPSHSPSTAVRVHRGLSWFGRAEQLVGDRDTQFVLLWVAFNAIYARQADDRQRSSQRAAYKAFLDELNVLDTAGSIENLVWSGFSGSIRLLLDNVYIFPDYWRHHAGALPASGWQRSFGSANQAAHPALGRRDTTAVLSIVLSRLYVLRNELVHGGATWNGRVNLAQVRDGANLLAKLVPTMLSIMLDHGSHDWGPAGYPVVE